MEKMISEACERNKGPILEKFKGVISSKKDLNILEIGSGTGQHAAFFASELSNVSWSTSDLQENHEQIKLWIEGIKNIKQPIQFESGKDEFPQGDFDFIYTANTLHIMSWRNVKTLIKQIGKALKGDGRVCIYGPFNYHGKFTSESNEQFDKWLKNRNSESGIRNFEDICNNFVKYNFILENDFAMPANNRFLVFKKIK